MLLPGIKESLQSRLADTDQGCMEYTGAKKWFGHGNFCYKGVAQLAHRVSWEIHFGEIPEGQCVLHLCDNPPCCNPEHLFLGSRADNAMDRDKKGRTAKGKRANAKLSTADIQYIRTNSENLTRATLAQKFQVHPRTIQRVKNDKSRVGA